MISRRANKDDIDQMLPLWQMMADMHADMDRMFVAAEGAAEKFREHLTSLLTKENFVVIVAEVDTKIVGYVIGSEVSAPDVFVIRRRMYIQDMVVDPDHRRQGIAKQLLDTIVAYAKEKDIQKLDLLVAVKNEAGQKFWKEVGFEPALTYMNLYLS